VPFLTRNAEHFAHQPFGQVPWLTDGDISIFESDAIVLHIGERSDGLTDCPACRDYVARATARPSFVKAYADQMAHFAAAD
jgi:glutathione S-transferase